MSDTESRILSRARDLTSLHSTCRIFTIALRGKQTPRQTGSVQALRNHSFFEEIAHGRTGPFDLIATALSEPRDGLRANYLLAERASRTEHRSEARSWSVVQSH